MVLLGKMALGIAERRPPPVWLDLQRRHDRSESSGETAGSSSHLRDRSRLLVPISVHFIPSSKLDQASAEIRPWMPTIRAALDQLREVDDLTLLEVTEPGQHVVVAKRAGSMVVDVTDKDETVHVSTPIRAIYSTMEQIAAANAETQD